MASLTFPLTAAQFWDRLPIEELVWTLDEALDASQTAGGEITVAERGTRLWRGKVRLGRMLWSEIAEVTALLQVLRGAGAGGGFLAWDSTRPGPRLDLNGGFLGAAAPTVTTISTDRREVTSSGWPGGYILAPGDLIGWSYGSAPVRRALHEVVQGATASVAGVLGPVEVVPAIRPGVVTGAAVTVIRPAMRALYLPGSWEPGVRRRGTQTGAAFGFVQTLGGP
jgi:hypothetical protein